MKKPRSGDGKDKKAKSEAPAPVPAAKPLVGEAATSADDASDFDPLVEFFVSRAERDIAEVSYGGGEANESRAAQQRSARNMVELLAFWVADEEYATQIIDIQEIIKLPTITEVPRAHGAVLGIISLRGTIVPVLDLRRILHLEEAPVTRNSRILVLRGEADPVGLLVDRVTSVVRLDSEAIESTPRNMKRHANELLRGVGRMGERLVIILDVPSVLAIMEHAA